MLGPFATASHFTLSFTRCRYCRHCRTPPVHRCPRRCPRRQRQQHVTEGTAMAPWNGPNNTTTCWPTLRTPEEPAVLQLFHVAAPATLLLWDFPTSSLTLPLAALTPAPATVSCPAAAWQSLQTFPALLFLRANISSESMYTKHNNSHSVLLIRSCKFSNIRTPIQQPCSKHTWDIQLKLSSKCKERQHLEEIAASRRLFLNGNSLMLSFNQQCQRN